MISADSVDEVNRRDFFAKVVERGGSLPYEEFADLAATHDLDEPWISEQKARGFVAFKDVDGGCVVSVTSKTTMRYRIESVETLV